MRSLRLAEARRRFVVGRSAGQTLGRIWGGVGVVDGGSTLTVAELRRLLRQADPRAFVVPARIVRRAIKHDRNLPSFALLVPHRRSFTLSRAAAAGVVERDELGLPDHEEIPETLILLSEPEADELVGDASADVIREYWRRLYHETIHVELDRRTAAGDLGITQVRERIRRIGLSAFEEARSVLRQEDFLLPPRTDQATYAEFAAVFLEFRAFDDDLAAVYFPSIVDRVGVEALLMEDVGIPDLLRRTRLAGASDPDPYGTCQITVSPSILDAAQAPSAAPDGLRYRRYIDQADKAEGRGNLVRAAICRTAAARLAGPSRAGQARSSARAAIDRLACRLRDALEVGEVERREWNQTLVPLLEPGSRGFWTAEARLLYDLQKVCFDHERPYYAVDLVEWARSWGKRPIRRVLPDHREVLMVLHLRNAARRLTAARLPDEARAKLLHRLDSAIHRSEARLRERFRPKIVGVLDETGFVPRNLPEQVAIEKLVEELLDRVVAQGFLSMGDLRDAVSRNDRKLPDLAGPLEFFRGDQLLRADRLLADVLDGVYRRGEIYLRALQRFSSVAFGTKTGRFLTRYLVLPYGGTAMILEGLQHVVGPIMRLFSGENPLPIDTSAFVGIGTMALALSQGGISAIDGSQLLDAPAIAGHVHPPGHAGELHILNPSTFAIGGTLALFLIASRDFRTKLGGWLRQSYRLGRDLFVGVPSWLLRSAVVRGLLASRSVALACRALVLPGLLAWVSWLIHPKNEAFGPSAALSGLVFLAASLLLTTRTGRDLEELAFDSVSRTLSWFFANLIPGLFRLVMEFFDRVLEGGERVIYTVDEWLRFRGGQNEWTFAIKAVLGVAWFFVAYAFRFVVTLLVEPQINPIKHFPVVTVSHKILLTQAFRVDAVMKGIFGKDLGLAIAGTVLLLTPGIFGFLVWEFKENWRLYQANRPTRLKPVVIGHHGETLVRLLKPGFHSGTIPKLFGKLRKAEWKATRTGRREVVRKHRLHLHEVEESVRHFVDREFRSLLARGQALGDSNLSVGKIRLTPKRVVAEICRADEPGRSATICFEEYAGWIVASLPEPGWIDDRPVDERAAIASALAGLYKMGGVELAREPIAAALGQRVPAIEFDFREAGVVVWPDPDNPAEVMYFLKPEAGTPPFVTIGHREIHPPDIDVARLIFADVEIPWARWVEVWEADRAGRPHPSTLAAGLSLLPPPPSPTPADLISAKRGQS